MSQKSGKRTRRRTEEDMDKTEEESKVSDVTEKEEIKKQELNEETQDEDTKGFHPTETIPNKTVDNKDSIDKTRIIQTRSRSSTPIVKKLPITEASNNIVTEKSDDEEKLVESTEVVNNVDAPNNDEKDLKETQPSDLNKNNADSESVEMEPLVLVEEAEPERQCDENSEVEIESEGLPTHSRTRKANLSSSTTPKPAAAETEKEQTEQKCYVSLVRLEPNVQAPSSTPKEQQLETELNGEGLEDDAINKSENSVSNDRDESSDSFASTTTENLSTKAVVGSDLTRNAAEFTFKDSGLLDDHSSSFLSISRDKSLVETCRRLSSRKTIRPLNDHYRKMAMRNNLESKDLDIPYPSRQSVERITGMKRKNSSMSPSETKRPRTDSSTLFSYISKPISHLKSRMSRSDLQSSTPKLTGYKTAYNDFKMESVSQIGMEVSKENSEKRWCSIM